GLPPRLVAATARLAAPSRRRAAPHRDAPPAPLPRRRGGARGCSRAHPQRRDAPRGPGTLPPRGGRGRARTAATPAGGVPPAGRGRAEAPAVLGLGRSAGTRTSQSDEGFTRSIRVRPDSARRAG